MPNWGQVLTEIEAQEAKLQTRAGVDVVRRRYLKRLYKRTGRPVIAYYSGWLTAGDLPGTDVNDEDKGAFMMAIHGLPKDQGLDLILHTPGGGIAAAESIVDYLHRMFGNDIRAIVPHIAMSAGTMIACACKSILMAKHSNLGPIDPQLNGLPAAAVNEEIARALNEIEENPAAIQVWQFILNKYNPTFIGQCEKAVAWAQEFVQKRLESNMFAGDADAATKAESVAKALSDVETHKAHDRHLHIDECMALGLKIEALEDNQELQDVMLTVHHCYMHSLSLNGSTKIVENHNGAAFIKTPIYST